MGLVPRLQRFTSMLRATSVALLLALAACPGGGEPDAGLDAGPDGGGLELVFSAHPELPAVATGVAIAEIQLTWRNVRAIGDSAPGDDRTSVAELELKWRPDDPPSALAFPAAPPGLYSRLEASLTRVEIRGSVRLLDGLDHPLEIDLDGSAAIAISLSGLALDAGGRTATIVLDPAFLGQLDWNAAPRDGDKVVIETEDTLAPAIRTGVAGAFSLGAVSLR